MGVQRVVMLTQSQEECLYDYWVEEWEKSNSVRHIKSISQPSQITTLKTTNDVKQTSTGMDKHDILDIERSKIWSIMIILGAVSLLVISIISLCSVNQHVVEAILFHNQQPEFPIFMFFRRHGSNKIDIGVLI